VRLGHADRRRGEGLLQISAARDSSPGHGTVYVSQMGVGFWKSGDMAGVFLLLLLNWGVLTGRGTFQCAQALMTGRNFA